MQYRRFIQWLGLLLMIIAGVLALAIALMYVGDYVVAPGMTVEQRNELIKTQVELIGTVGQLLGGLFIIISLIVAWRTFKINHETQIAERYTAAMNQIGSEHIETRIGAIYSLGRIAQDSSRDYWPIIQILTAYIRVNAPLPTGRTTPVSIEPDIQAILNVLKQRSHHYGNGEKEGLDLSRTNLRGAHLEDVHLECADFRSCCLDHAHLQGAFLQGARLEEADLTRAGFQDANLTHADLGGATLNRALFHRAVFEATDLREARLVDVEGLTLEQLQHAHCNREELPETLRGLLTGEQSRHV